MKQEFDLHRILKASERLSAAYYQCETRLGPEDVYVTEKSVVVRFRLRKCSQHCPASVIAKHILSNPTDRVPRELRFIDECAALKFLNKVAAVPALSPGYYGADRVERVIVMEDLGACYRDTTYQLVRGNDSERAEAAMMTHVAAIGRLHALTIGRRKEYESIRISLGGATEKSHLFQEQWPSARLAEISSWEIEIVHKRYAHQFQKLGICPSKGFDGEIVAVVKEVERNPREFLAFSQGDQIGPGGAIQIGGHQRFYDFDCSGFRHALLEGVPGRTTWGCVMAIPHQLSAQLERVYRTALAQVSRAASDNDVFHQALVVATARWHIFKVLRHLNGCLAEDAPRGPTTRRQQFLAWLDVFGSMTEEFAFMTALGKSARAMAVRLRARWPADVHTLPLYPAFRDSRWDQTCHVRLGPG
jgi:hypothetical protein